MRGLKHGLEYLALWIAALFAMCIPWRAVRPLSRILGTLLSYGMPGRTRLVLSNLRIAFPDWSDERLKKMALDFWRQMAQTVLECLRALHNGSAWIRQNVVLENPEILETALKEGKGVILHTGHFSNWEFTGSRIALHGFPLAVIGRTQKNLMADRFLTRFRQKLGMTVFNHHQAVRETQRWLKQNGVLGILSDHNLYKGGIFVQFFNKPASATTLTALLHSKLESPVVGVYAQRKGERQHVRFERIEFSKIAAQEPDKNARVAAMTQHLTDRLESWVSNDPKSWLWGHNRWKRQP